MDEKMDVLTAFDAKYLPHATTMLCSLLTHNDVERVHVFHGSVDKYKLRKLRGFIETFGTTATFYEIEPAQLPAMPVDRWASAANYYRLLATKMLSDAVERVLYLDADLIVRQALSELWEVDLKGQCVAAVRDLDLDRPVALGFAAGSKYFNSGVLLIDLASWRREKVCERALAFIRDYPEKAVLWDQDALNVTLVGRWMELPRCWNAQYEFLRDHPGESPPIAHFCGPLKPWHWSAEYPFQGEYLMYRGKTPWPLRRLEGEPTFGRWLLNLVRKIVRTLLPDGVRRWLRARRLSYRAAI